MVKRVIVMALLATFVSAPAFAQRVEVSGLFGWTLSDGVTGAPVLSGDGNLYDTIDVKDSASWGFSVGFNATETSRSRLPLRPADELAGN